MTSVEPHGRFPRILIVGLGSVGQRHARNLLALTDNRIELSACSTGAGTEVARAALEASGLARRVRIHQELGAALDDAPDAVVICNPTSLHVPAARAAAERGCHLFIEKPLSHSRDGVPELRDLVHQRGLIATVGFQFRHHPGLRATRQLVADGAIGRPVCARVTWGEYLPGWHPGEDHRQGYSARADLGGGVVLTLCHPFDYLRWIFGDVHEVSAVTAGDALGLGVEDVADVVLTFASGVQAHVHLDYVQRPPVHEMVVVGSEGTLHWNGLAHSLQLHSSGTSKAETWPSPAGFERNTMFLDEMREFVGSVSDAGAPRGPDLDDGLATLNIALAALASARAKRAVALQS